MEVRKLFDIFTQCSLNNKLDKNNFFAALARLEEAGLKNLNDTPFGDRLFEMLDRNRDGMFRNLFLCLCTRVAISLS